MAASGSARNRPCVELDSRLHLDDSIKARLSQHEIGALNTILDDGSIWSNPDDRALGVLFLHPHDTHAALALPFSPVAPGPDPTASVAALRTWIIQQAALLPGFNPATNQVGDLPAFHHLTGNQTVHMTNLLWQNIPWVAAIVASEIEGDHVGTVLQIVASEIEGDHVGTVLQITGSEGRGRAEAFIVPQIFG